MGESKNVGEQERGRAIVGECVWERERDCVLERVY